MGSEQLEFNNEPVADGANLSAAIHATPGHQMSFTLRRTVDDDLTFSQSGIDVFIASINEFIGSRVVKHIQTGGVPRKVDVIISVEVM